SLPPLNKRMILQLQTMTRGEIAALSKKIVILAALLGITGVISYAMGKENLAVVVGCTAIAVFGGAVKDKYSDFMENRSAVQKNIGAAIVAISGFVFLIGAIYGLEKYANVSR
ncbi:MAG: hypothetical protein H0X29_12000, partial [Parachlamydiaceae bacterium]|nr:hypothetical protein [Parachlamydiaceae bacterium]